MIHDSKVKLIVALVAVCGALVGSAVAALRWRSDNEVWRDRALSAEVELTKVKPALERAEAALAAIEEESGALQERVAELANEKAQAQDSVAIVEVERAAFERVAKAYSEVSAKWAACVKGHEQYEVVLKNTAKYDSADVRRFLKDLEGLCSDAQKADDVLRSQLSR